MQKEKIEFEKEIQNVVEERRTENLKEQSKSQQTASTISKVKLLIQMIEGSIEKNNASMNAKKRVVMLPKSYLSISEDKENKEYFVNEQIKPQMFSVYKSKKAILATSSHSEGAPIAVTKLEYLKCRLKAAKFLLELLEKSIKEAPVNIKRRQLKALRKKYNDLSEVERDAESGVEIREKMIKLRADLGQ